MGCLVGNVTRVSEGLRMGVEKIGENIQLSANRISEGLQMGVGRIGTNLQLSANRVSEGLRMGVGLVCSVGDVYIISFEKDSLLWLGADNREGVTKYNTITASGSWSLEEVEIEELL